MEITPYSARLSYFKIPVETFTPPLMRDKETARIYISVTYIIHQLFCVVKVIPFVSEGELLSATPRRYRPKAGMTNVKAQYDDLFVGLWLGVFDKPIFGIAVFNKITVLVVARPVISHFWCIFRAVGVIG